MGIHVTLLSVKAAEKYEKRHKDRLRKEKKRSGKNQEIQVLVWIYTIRYKIEVQQ
jgi:hypothetical protein